MSDSEGARFRRVIVGVDGRPAARDAIALARLLAATDRPLVLAHVHAGDLRPSRTSSLPFDAIQRDESQLLLEHERTASGVDAELASVAAPSVGSGLHRSARRTTPTCSSSAPAPAASAGASSRATIRAPRSTARPARSPSHRSATRTTPIQSARSASATTARPRARPRWRSRGGSRRGPAPSCRRCRSCRCRRPRSPASPPTRGATSSRTSCRALTSSWPRSTACSRRPCSGCPARSWPRSATAWTCSSSAPAATGRCAASCSEAPRRIWPPTRAAPCSCSRVRPRRAGTTRPAAAAHRLPRAPD